MARQADVEIQIAHTTTQQQNRCHGKKWRSSPTSQCHSRIEPLLSSSAPSWNPTELPQVISLAPSGSSHTKPSPFAAPRLQPRPSAKSVPKLHTRQES